MKTWVLTDEELFYKWKKSKRKISHFITLHRKEIDFKISETYKARVRKALQK